MTISYGLMKDMDDCMTDALNHGVRNPNMRPKHTIFQVTQILTVFLSDWVFSSHKVFKEEAAVRFNDELIQPYLES